MHMEISTTLQDPCVNKNAPYLETTIHSLLQLEHMQSCCNSVIYLDIMQK